MDFGLLPPEVNSARMYAGAGPGPILAAAAAWDGLATDLHNMAVTYESAISDLSAGWQGPSSQAMAAAAKPYTAWLHTTAAQAEQTATQSRMAAAAYEAAFAATVPPPLVTANRTLLTTLVATNLLGQNTPAIAATEAHYAEMWAQDAVAMYCYAGSSTTATQLEPFSWPPQTVNPAAAAGQSAAVTQTAGSAVASNAQTPLADLATLMSHLTGPYSPIGIAAIPGGWWLTAMQVLGTAQNVPGVLTLLNGPAPITGALGPLSGGYVSYQVPIPGATPAVGPGTVLASTGRAMSIGALSVPASWAPTGWNPAAQMLKELGAGSALAGAGQETMFGEMALSSLAGRALAGTAAHSVVGSTARVIDRKSTVVGDDDPSAVTIVVIQPNEE